MAEVLRRLRRGRFKLLGQPKISSNHDSHIIQSETNTHQVRLKNITQ